MNLLLLRCTPSYSILHSSTVSCFDRGPKISSPILRTAAPVSATTIPARDRVIDFGKYKGKMLGTLPSTYLNWVSKNLRASDFREWAQLVDQGLNDPLYRDRIEWELAEKLLNGDVFCSSGSGSRADQNAVSELLEISEMFGWDNEDKLGWSKIDFGLLGTSKGGRIPRRVSEKGGVGREIREKRETSSRVCDGGSSRMRRMERRERGRLKRSNGLLQWQHLPMGGWTMSSTGTEDKGRDSFEDGDDEVGLDLDLDGNQEIYKDGAAAETRNRIIIRNPFPGRRALLKKVLLSRRSL